jgi:5-bromo-4-chloroindolyl phosphate hydrolysis protein
MEELSFQVKLDEKDYLALRYWSMYGSSSGKMRLLLCVFIILDLLFLSFLVRKTEYGLFMFLLGIASLVIIVYLVLSPIAIYFQARSIYHSDQFLQQNQKYDLSNQEGIVIATESSNARIKWDQVVKLAGNKKYFYIFTAKNKALIIPKKALEASEQVADFVGMFQSNIPSKRMKIKI